MEFLDNSGHIFSLTSYNQKPIGYEYDENPYVFYMNDNKHYRLSINNYYIRTIYVLYNKESDFNLDNFNVDIYFNNTNVYKLISPIKFQEKISNLKNLSDSIEFDFDDDEIIKTSLTKDDIYCIETTDTINNIDYDYYLIPIYVLSYCTEEGTWLSNLMIHFSYNNEESWCPITIGAVYVDEYEELIINGENMGVSLPKDIIKAIYSESVYNNEFNLELYNRKLKEYLINYMSIKGELGNYNSVINSLKWFGYGDKIILSKLIKTDNDIMNQYIRDYFNIENDILKSFSKFKNDSLLSLIIMTNKELDETNGIDLNEENSFMGEDKPKLYSLLENYEKIKINNHDLPIDDDPEKYFYWKPYFDFSFNELCIKLVLVKNFFKKYFLPIHLNVHTASLGERVFMNDVKITSSTNNGMTSPLICTYKNKAEVSFLGNGLHYYTKQIHYIDDNFNEFNINYINNNYNEIFYELNDTCISIPIRFKNNNLYNCILILERYNEVLYESHFSFYNDINSYRNFIIYPKKLNTKNLTESNIFEYWINCDFRINLCVNGRWYYYDFKTKISKPVIDFGKLRYKYKFNNIKDLLGYTPKEDNVQHSLLTLNTKDESCNLDNNIIVNNGSYNTEDLYDLLNLDDSKSVIIPAESNVDNYNSIIDYSNYSKFSQIENITNEKINFNAFMHNHKLVESNHINFDVDFYKVLKYHLENNLQYIDGTLINNQFYTYINYYSPITNDDTRIELFFKNEKNIIFGFNAYKLKENGNYVKLSVKPSKNKLGYDLFDELNNFVDHWNNNETLYLRYEIYIHKDLIGYPIEIRNTYISNLATNLLYAYNNQIFILRETDTNSNVFEIINEDYAILNEEVLEDDVFGIILESFDFMYDNINDRYYHKYDDDSIDIFELYDKLFQDSDEYYNNFKYKANILYSDRYLNAMHLFGIYSRNYKLTNILNFNQETDINVNGINFKYINKYLDEYTNEELSLIDENNILTTEVFADKFLVSGHILRDYIDADTRYPDVYGLYWEHYLKDEYDRPYLHFNKDNEEYQNFGIYVKREFNKEKSLQDWRELDNEYYTQEEVDVYNSNLEGAISTDDWKITPEVYENETIEGVHYTQEEVNEYNSKLDGAVSTDTIKAKGVNIDNLTFDEYYYETDDVYTELGYFRFDTLEDFYQGNYNKEYLPEDFYGELKFIVDENNNHKYQWVDTNLYNVVNQMNPQVYDLDYQIYVKDTDNDELININPSTIYNKNYEYILIKFVYYKVYLVKNKYYQLNDYLENKLDAERINGKYVINNKEIHIMYSYDEQEAKEYNMTLEDAYNLNHPVYYTQEEADEYNEEHEFVEGDDEFKTTESIKCYSIIIYKTYTENDVIPQGYSIGSTYYTTKLFTEEECYEHNLTLPGAHNYLSGYSNVWVMIYTDNEDVEHIIEIMRVSNVKRYIDMFGQEIKIQNPSGYWYNVDNKNIQDLPSALNELKRYWFNENEDNTVGDTLEEIRNSLETYKQKLEKFKQYHNNNTIILPEYGLNMKNNIELRYRYKNFLSKYITGLKGKFRIEWSYVDKEGNIDISNMLDDSVKIFNLCVCITNEDDSINIYSTNGEEFELKGNEKEVVVYFRLATTDKQGMITPFYIKPKLISIYEVNERLKYNYKESGNELQIKIGNRTYLYGDNSSEYVINLYNMFFDNTWNLYDLYPNEDNVLVKQLIHKIYDKNNNIKINKDDLYDFYLMHDNDYWYGLYISKYTCDNIDLRNIVLEQEDKIKYLNDLIMMKYERSSKEFLINRMEYISANGINHFLNDDIICAYMMNNDRLPIRIDISSKWRIYPMSLGMDKTSDFESNAEMTIISMPYNDNKYQKGYYKATVRYSLDRDLQHQFKDTTTFRIS